jgi:hypothetical protein
MKVIHGMHIPVICSLWRTKILSLKNNGTFTCPQSELVTKYK